MGQSLDIWSFVQVLEQNEAGFCSAKGNNIITKRIAHVKIETLVSLKERIY